MSAFTSLFFELAKEILKNIIERIFEGKGSKMDEEKIREVVLEYMANAQPTTTISYDIDVESINILMNEIYAVAGATKGVEVIEDVIKVKPKSKIQLPTVMREKRITNFVQDIRETIVSLTDDEIVDIGMPEIEEEFHPTKEKEDRPLMFANQDDVLELKFREASNIVSDYKKRIATIIDEENLEE